MNGALFSGVRRQNHISDRMPLPVDIVSDSASILDVSSETVQLYYFNSGVLTQDAGQAAGTVVVAKLNYSGILDGLGAMIGNNLATSFSWGTDTVLPIANMQPCNKELIEAADKATLEEVAIALTENFSNGEWCMDHRTGFIVGKKATTGTSDTATYKVQTQSTTATSGSLAEVEGDVAHDAADSGNPVKIGFKAQDPTSLPSAVAVNDRVDAMGDEYGRIVTNQGTNTAGEDRVADVLKVEQRGTMHYVATAATDEVIKASPGFLYGILIGEDVASSTIEISDHASDGDGNVKIFLDDDALMTATGGYMPVNAQFNTGITADIVNQTKVTFFYR